MQGNQKRKQKDVTRIMVSGHDVDLVDEERMDEFIVKFKGPQDSLYTGGVWKVRVQLPDQYPIKSPSIGFINKIYHPNIDEGSGSVCLDVINQQWSPMYDLVNIFEIFLPQLLLYPNSSDPLNAEAAQLQMKNQEHYNSKVKQYVQKYALDPDAAVSEPQNSHQPTQADFKQNLPVVDDQWQSNGIDHLSETSDIEMVQISDDEEMKE